MNASESQERKLGRPRLEQGPKVPYDEIETLLVEGELVLGDDGVERRVWPSQREIARRFGVASSLINVFAKQRRCAERKAELLVAYPPSTLELGDDGPRRRPGRPRKADAPPIPYEELDRLLVFGEVEVLEDGTTTTVYPSYRQLAERYDVMPSVIANYAKSHNCMRRREQNAKRIAVRTEEKLIDLRAEVISVGEDRLVQMIDNFLLSFEKALEEGRVRADNPTDVNTLARLKAFIMGGADSRHEIRAILSLESLQERYARVMRDQRDATSEMTGVIDAHAVVVEEGDPPPSNEKVSVQLITEQAGSRSITQGRSITEAEQKLNTLRELVEELASLARELALLGDSDPEDESLLENRVLRAVERVEAYLFAEES